MPVLVLDAAAICLACIASATFYLGCPNQQWLPERPARFYLMAAIAFAILAPAWLLFKLHMSLLSASFTLLTVTMLCLSLLPFLTRFGKPLTNNTKKKSSLDKSRTEDQYRPSWWLRIIGTFLLAFPLAVSTTGLFAYLGPGGLTNDIKTQLVMWLITPLLLLPLSLVFFVRNVLHALSVLLCLNLIASTLLWYLSSSV